LLVRVPSIPRLPQHGRRRGLLYGGNTVPVWVNGSGDNIPVADNPSPFNASLGGELYSSTFFDFPFS